MLETESQGHREQAVEPAALPHLEQPHVEQPHVEQPQVEQPRMEAPTVAKPRQEMPRIDPQEILSAAGLQMVETRASKSVQPAPESEPVQLGRPRRERPAAAAATEAELVQVETQNK